MKNKSKKVIGIILSIFFGLFSTFGILGFIVFIFEGDIFGLIFYLVWAILGILLFIFFLRWCFPSKGSSPSKQEQTPILNTEKEAAKTSIPSTVQNNTVFPSAYIAFDIETPNRKNDRISQIGLILVEDGNVIKDYSTLIDPETYFEHLNTEITGIDSNSVANAPTFKEYWPEISHLFDKYVLVAHNANFDLTVLSKTLSYYGFEQPKIKYICTYEESLNKFPELKKHSLESLAEYFGITQEFAHNASYDAKICSKIFEKMKEGFFHFSPSLFSFEVTELKGGNGLKYEKDSLSINIPFNTPKIIEISGNAFVTTGVFSMVNKKDIEEFLLSNGGFVRSAVSGKTNYLIVGANPEPAWKHGNYGRKIEKAIELLKSGKSDLFIIPESEFVSMFESELR